jgi:uncharacterized protein YkwD
MAKIKNRGSDTHKTKPKGIAKHTFERVYWPYLPVILIAGVLLSIGGRSGSLSTYVHHPGGRVLDYATSMSLDGLLADTNNSRAQNGVAPLQLSSKLDAAAQAKADDMARRDYWSHYTPDGSPPWVFVAAQGYSYQKLGENLATGFSNEQATINGWMASPPHRANLLNPSFKDVGFGFSNNPNYTAAGGGPMTIMVAFYGESLSTVVASASTSTPLPTQGATTSVSGGSHSPTVKPSRVQLAFGSSRFSALTTGVALAGGVLLGIFWVSRHLKAIHRFLLKGERYAVRHPLADLGLIIIAALLFILSQTAGLIQ